MPPSIVFKLPSIHFVLKAEKTLLKAGLPFDLIPVPKEVNPDCGLAVETEPARAREVFESLNAQGLPIEALYRRQDGIFSLMDEKEMD